jgi:hypothetical protein
MISSESRSAMIWVESVAERGSGERHAPRHEVLDFPVEIQRGDWLLKVRARDSGETVAIFVIEGSYDPVEWLTQCMYGDPELARMSRGRHDGSSSWPFAMCKATNEGSPFCSRRSRPDTQSRVPPNCIRAIGP